MRFLKILLLSVPLVVLISACADGFDDDFGELAQIQSSGFDWPRTVTSAAGTLVRNTPAEKILTLSAGHDEIVFELLEGDTGRLVGISSVTPSYSNIMDRVGDLTPVSKNTEQILALDPDVVIVDAFTTADFIRQLQTVGIAVFQTEHDGANFNIDNILTLGYLLGLEDAAQRLVASINERIAYIADNLPTDTAPQVLLASKFEQIWASGSGSTGGNILDAIGISNAAAVVPANNGTISIESIAHFAPDVILINGGGAPFRAELLEHDALAGVPAVASMRVEVVDERYTNLLSHWNVCAAEQFAAIVFPAQFGNLAVCESFLP